MTHPVIDRILSHCRELGATVESKRTDSGYLSSCSYGTPWTKPSIREEGSEPIRGGFIQHLVCFAEPVDLVELCSALGVQAHWAWTWRNGQRVSRTIQAFQLWERPELLDALGQYGDGLCIMQETAPRPEGYHWTLERDGLRDGMFG